MASTSFAVEDPYLDRLFRGHKGEITGLSFNCDTTQLVSSSTDGSLLLWDFKKKARAIRLENHLDSVTGVQFSPTQKLIASCSKDKTVRLWKPFINSSSKMFKAHTSAIRSIHFSHDSTNLVTASNDKNIKMWMTEYNNKFISSFCGHTHWVNCARFSHRGQFVVSASEDRTTKLWDRLSSVCIYTFEEQNGIPIYVEFHPNDKCIAVGYANEAIKIYDIRTYKLLQHYSAHSNIVNAVSFHPNGKFMISGSSDKTVKVFDLIEGRTLYTLEGHEAPVTTVVFSPDGCSFASGGVDKMILVWKCNFDNEVLVKPLETDCNIQSKKDKEGRSVRNLDARQSFSAMEQPDVEVSNPQTNSSDTSDGINMDNEVSNIPLQSFMSEEESVQARGDQGNITEDLLQSLTQEVHMIRNMVADLSKRVEQLEVRAGDQS